MLSLASFTADGQRFSLIYFEATVCRKRDSAKSVTLRSFVDRNVIVVSKCVTSFARASFQVFLYIDDAEYENVVFYIGLQTPTHQWRRSVPVAWSAIWKERIELTAAIIPDNRLKCTTHIALPVHENGFATMINLAALGLCVGNKSVAEMQRGVVTL